MVEDVGLGVLAEALLLVCVDLLALFLGLVGTVGFWRESELRVKARVYLSILLMVTN